MPPCHSSMQSTVMYCTAHRTRQGHRLRKCHSPRYSAATKNREQYMPKYIRLFQVERPALDRNSTRHMLNSSMPKIITQITSRETRLCCRVSSQKSRRISRGMRKNSVSFPFMPSLLLYCAPGRGTAPAE